MNTYACLEFLTFLTYVQFFYAYGLFWSLDKLHYFVRARARANLKQEWNIFTCA